MTKEKTTAKPSDWKILDTLIMLKEEVFEKVQIIRNIKDMEDRLDFFFAGGLAVQVLKGEPPNHIHNIDAELRAKDAEIERLKNPWCYDLDTMPKPNIGFLCKYKEKGKIFSTIAHFSESPMQLRNFQDETIILNPVAWMPIPELKKENK